MSYDVAGHNTAGGEGSSSVSRTTSVRAPNSASRETIKSSLSDSGTLATDGTLRQADGVVSGDGTYGLGQNGTGTVTLYRVANSTSGGTHFFDTASGTLANGTTLGGNGNYVLSSSGRAQQGNVNLVRDGNIDLQGTSGSFSRTPILDANENQTGESWSGTLTKSTDNGQASDTTSGDVQIDENGNVTGNASESDDSGGTETTSVLVYSGSYNTPAEGPKTTAASRQLDTYTTTSKNTPASGEKPASTSSTDVHTWQAESLSVSQEEIYEYDPGDEFTAGYEFHDLWMDRPINRAEGVHTTTVTLAGDKASASIVFESSFYDESPVANKHSEDSHYRRDFYDGEDDAEKCGISSDLVVHEGTEKYTYSSNHSVGDRGRAYGGHFEAESGARTRSSTVSSQDWGGFGQDNILHDQYVYEGSTFSVRNVDGILVTGNATESGSYEDWALPGGGAVRVQNGTYATTTVSHGETIYESQSDAYVGNSYSELGPAEHNVISTQTRENRDVTTTTTGKYDPYGASETTAVSEDYEKHIKSDSDTDYRDVETHYFGRYWYDLETHVSPDSASGHGEEHSHGIVPIDTPYSWENSWDPFEGQDPPAATPGSNKKSTPGPTTLEIMAVALDQPTIDQLLNKLEGPGLTAREEALLTAAFT